MGFILSNSKRPDAEILLRVCDNCGEGINEYTGDLEAHQAFIDAHTVCSKPTISGLDEVLTS